MRSSFPLLCGAICLVTASALAGTQTMVFKDGVSPGGYSGTRDITISNQVPSPQNDPDTTYDISPNKMDGYTTIQSTLLRWDLSSLQGVTVNSARIIIEAANAAPVAFPIHELLKPWNETSTTWNRASTGNPWTLPGANAIGVDRSGIVVGLLAAPTLGAHTEVLNADGVAMVQRWIDNPAGNFGVWIGDPWRPDAISFVSNEGAAASTRPRLEITHSGGTVASFQNGVAPSSAYRGSTDVVIASQRSGWNGQGLLAGNIANILIRFDLSALPSGTPIIGADLLVRAGTKGASLDLYESLTPWTEAATWNTRDGTTAWSSPGATGVNTDYGGPLLLQTGPAGAGGEYTFAFNAEGVATLQAWVDGTRPNHGFVMPDASTSGTTFFDRESTDPAARPALRITYSTPDPADTTPPTAGSVADGVGADIEAQTSLTSLAANWTGFADPESGVASYEWAIGTSAGATDVQGFTSVGVSTNATATGLSLVNGALYFVTVRAANGAGLTQSSTSDGVVVDSTPPLAGSVSDGAALDLDVQSSSTSLAAYWTGFADPESGVASYAWAIGTSPGAEDVQGFFSIGPETSAAATGLSLVDGTQYYVTVQATNAAGSSVTASSDGLFVVVTPGAGDAGVDDAGTGADDAGTDATDAGVQTLRLTVGCSSTPGNGSDFWILGVAAGLSLVVRRKKRTVVDDDRGPH